MLNMKRKLSIILCFGFLIISYKIQCCLLCSNGDDLQENHKKLYCQKDEFSDCRLFETTNFYIVVDNYPVCQDHILIVPKEHKCSYSVVDQNLEFELEAIIKTLSEVVKTFKYGLFEHGSNFVGIEQKACGNSVYHAHMHFIPNLELSKNELLDLCCVGDKSQVISLKEGCDFDECFSRKKTHQTILGYLKKLPTSNPYLFCYYSNVKRASLCIPDDVIQGGVPSQFFRRVFAEHFQKGTKNIFWNWKSQRDVELSIEFRKNIVWQTVKKFSNKEDVLKLFVKNLKLLKVSSIGC